jgi:hypothetical protein
MVNSTSRYGRIYFRLGRAGVVSLDGMRELVDKYKSIITKKLVKEIFLELDSTGGN